MEKNLIFGDSFTIEEFKSLQKTETIQVKENPLKPGSLFMTNSKNKVIGAVSSKALEAGGITKPLVTEVTTPEGSTFFLLHQMGEGGAKVIATF